MTPADTMAQALDRKAAIRELLRANAVEKPAIEVAAKS